MDDGIPSDNERRRYLRCEMAATAIVLRRNRYAGMYLVENLSAGGSLLMGDPRLEEGERVKILLHLAGLRPINLAGQVVRHEVRDTGEHCFAIAFRNVSAATEDIIQQAVLSTLERMRRCSPPPLPPSVTGQRPQLPSPSDRGE